MRQFEEEPLLTILYSWLISVCSSSALPVQRPTRLKCLGEDTDKAIVSPTAS